MAENDCPCGSEDAVLDFLPLSTRGEHRGGHEALV